MLWTVIALAGWVLAIELGIGRPDKPRCLGSRARRRQHASAQALATLPGIDAALATRIVELHGFASVHDLGGVFDLDASAVERLRDRVVFLPR